MTTPAYPPYAGCTQFATTKRRGGLRTNLTGCIRSNFIPSGQFERIRRAAG